MRVATALGNPRNGEDVVAALRARMANTATKPRVALIEWIEPLMAGGNWMPELVEMAGGENLFGKAGEHSPWLEILAELLHPESIAPRHRGRGWMPL